MPSVWHSWGWGVAGRGWGRDWPPVCFLLLLPASAARPPGRSRGLGGGDPVLTANLLSEASHGSFREWLWVGGVGGSEGGVRGSEGGVRGSGGAVAGSGGAVGGSGGLQVPDPVGEEGFPAGAWSDPGAAVREAGGTSRRWEIPPTVQTPTGTSVTTAWLEAPGTAGARLGLAGSIGRGTALPPWEGGSLFLRGILLTANLKQTKHRRIVIYVLGRVISKDFEIGYLPAFLPRRRAL